MRLAKEIYRDQHSGYTKEYNVDGAPFKEVYHAAYLTQSKESVYNDQKKVTSIFTLKKGNGQDSWDTEEGFVTVYTYSGESYIITGYAGDTKSYANFIAGQHLIPGKTDWHYPAEAYSTHTFTIEKGQLIAEQYHNLKDNIKQSSQYTYENGLKTLEIKVAEDGTIRKITFIYENGLLTLKNTFVHGELIEMIIYTYKDGLLSGEQELRKYKDTQYIALQKKFFYDAQKKLTKTEYYGRYDAKMYLFKIEENIRKGDTLTKKSAVISILDGIVGHYDLSALCDTFGPDQRAWALTTFDPKNLDTVTFDGQNCIIEKYDDHEQMIEYAYMHPGKQTEVLAKMCYRNEYNDKDLPEFIISYRMAEDGKMEETDIKKFYYHN